MLCVPDIALKSPGRSANINLFVTKHPHVDFPTRVAIFDIESQRWTAVIDASLVHFKPRLFIALRLSIVSRWCR